MRKVLDKLSYPLVILVLLFTLSYLHFDYKKDSLPDTFTVVAGQSAAVFEDNDIEISSLSKGKNEVLVKMWGVVPLKSVSIDVVDSQSVIPCGTPVGIYIETEGVLVIDVVDITDDSGNVVRPAESKLCRGDYILEANGEKIDSKNDLIKAIYSSKGDNIVLKIARNESISEIKIQPVRTDNNQYKIGVWVRDDTQGLGMMTYVTGDGHFAALGHGINDPDTSDLMELSEGLIFQAEILEITKGTDNSPGALMGTIYYGSETLLGQITTNSNIGVYGDIVDLPDAMQNPIQIGYKQDIVTGPAQILTTVEKEVMAYDIEIIGVDIGTNDNEKSFMIKVTDQELIDKTGGIVQGMSGSPIIQNGKIIGAVTHVLVNDPTMGYGIFIENMLEECE